VTVALVPTMGALHDGHVSLLREGRRRGDELALSIFVNPTQFAPNEDLDRYPRTFEQDCALLAEAGADLVYAPSATDMYPEGFSTRVVPGGPASSGLEDAARPHFFAGVATVVTKLLLQTQPDVAIFGEKDFQQLRAIQTIVRDLDIPVTIIGVPTVREADGLALSSRNRFLTTDERHRARLLPMALSQAAEAIRGGVPVDRALASARDELISVGAVIDYFELRDADSLVPVSEPFGGRFVRLLAAVRIGSTRLIDNVAL
jgi:pantoate--beta-alanine ligase